MLWVMDQLANRIVKNKVWFIVIYQKQIADNLCDDFNFWTIKLIF